MSQLTHPIGTYRAHRVVVLAALLALAATTAIVLVLAIGGSSNDASDASVTPANATPQSSVRYDGGPNEGASAASFQPQPSTAAQTFGHR